MTNPTKPGPDAVCVCGHPKDRHKPYAGHLLACFVGCVCMNYRPASTDSPAHDTPAAKLRERLAEAERELAMFLKNSNGETLQELFDKGKLNERSNDK